MNQAYLSLRLFAAWRLTLGAVTWAVGASLANAVGGTGFPSLLLTLGIGASALFVGAVVALGGVTRLVEEIVRDVGATPD